MSRARQYNALILSSLGLKQFYTEGCTHTPSLQCPIQIKLLNKFDYAIGKKWTTILLQCDYNGCGRRADSRPFPISLRLVHLEQDAFKKTSLEGLGPTWPSQENQPIGPRPNLAQWSTRPIAYCTTTLSLWCKWSSG